MLAKVASRVIYWRRFMKAAHFLRVPFVAAFAVMLVFSGCAVVNEMGSGATEETLIASGFRARPADTPQKQAILEELPAYQVVPHNFRGRELYVYADPAKDVVYVGGPAEYQQYNQRLLEQTADNESLMEAQDQAAAAQMSSAFDWGLYGPYWW